MNEDNRISQEYSSMKGLRLGARITGTLWILFCLLFMIGYMMEGIQRNGGGFGKPTDWLGVATEVLIFIGLGGLFIAYWREGAGGLISLIAFFLSTVFLIADPKLTFSFIFLFIYLPTILYLAYWWGNRNLKV
ncbi:MAG: hypothetical protein WCP08_00375 [Prolixibacteraceae bacterium]